jgi:hypothetical protein
LLIFQLLVLTPLWVYLLAKYPGWSMLYFSSAEDVSVHHGFGIVLLCFAAAAASYQLGHFLCGKKQDRLLIGAVAFSCIVLLVFFLLAGERLGSVAEDSNWQHAPGLFESELGTLLAFVIPVVLGGLIFLLVLFSMEGRKVRRASFSPGGSNDPRGSKPTVGVPSGSGSKERKMSPVFGGIDISSSGSQFPDTTPSLTQQSDGGSGNKQKKVTKK